MFQGDCDIRLELHDEGRSKFTTNDVISGTVVVEVSEDVTCNHLDIELSWLVQGRGSDSRETALTERLFTGKWTAGQTYTYDFEVELPAGPCSYDGAYFDLDWEIAATADIPWALDPSDATHFVLEPGSTARNPSVGEMNAAEYLDAQPQPESSVKWGFTAFGAICLVVGLVLLAPYFLDDATWIPLLIGLPVTLMAFWMVYTGLKNYIVELRLGDIDIALSSVWVSPGGALTCDVRLEPTSTVTLNGLELRLTATELTSRGHDEESAEAFEGIVYEANALNDESINRRLDAKTPVSFSETVDLEHTAPCTLTAGRNQVTWHLEATIDIPGWPDWTYTRRLLVTPGAKRLPERIRVGPASADLIAGKQSNESDTTSTRRQTEDADVHW